MLMRLILATTMLVLPAGVAEARQTSANSSTSSTAPTASTASKASAAAAARGCQSNRMGIPSSGAYAGATSTNHGNVAIHREYFGSNASSAVKAARSDLKSGRLPWISLKAPHSWSAMASGAGDAWAKSLAQQLSSVGGPVWLAVEHEPEGGGDTQAWVRMQRRLAPIIHANSNNVAYTIIVTAWDNFFGPKQYSMNNLWPGSMIDVLGSDAYDYYGARKGGKTISTHSDMSRYYDKLGPWAASHHVKWAIGESAYTNASAAKDPSWLNRAFSELKAAHGIAYSYFDSGKHSIGSWPLSTAAKQAHFEQILKESTRIC
jgi:hypothetical protein